MVLGRNSKPVAEVKLTAEQKAAKKAFIKKKVNKLKNSIKIPGPINQFKTYIKGSDESTVLDLLKKYSPETKAEKKQRLSKSNPKEGAKPILLKFGLKHITDLIEKKKAKFVVISADVVPITNICFIPTLCKKMGVSYAVVDKQSKLGALVHMKKTAVVALEDVRAEDKSAFTEVLRISNAAFADRYEEHMSTIGGNVRAVNQLE